MTNKESGMMLPTSFARTVRMYSVLILILLAIPVLILLARLV